MSVYAKKIFTFINFQRTVPAYIDLCIKTWVRNLAHQYEIIVLTPQNISEFIDKEFLTESVLKPSNPFSYFFNDYIAFLVLYCQGGIFFDSDTLITDVFNKNFNLSSGYDAVLFNEKQSICPGFIMAKKQAPFLEELILRYRIENYFLSGKRRRNYIINDVIKNNQNENILFIDSKKSGYKMEHLLFRPNNKLGYRNYYFSKNVSIENFIKKNKGIAALHNSVTPDVYKNMTQKEFLEQDILLAKIFKVLL